MSLHLSTLLPLFSNSFLSTFPAVFEVGRTWRAQLFMLSIERASGFSIGALVKKLQLFKDSVHTPPKFSPLATNLRHFSAGLRDANDIEILFERRTSPLHASMSLTLTPSARQRCSKSTTQTPLQGGPENRFLSPKLYLKVF